MGNFPGWRCAISTRACPWRARRPRSGPRSLIVRRDASGPRARAPVFKPRVPGRSTTHERTRPHVAAGCRRRMIIEGSGRARGIAGRARVPSHPLDGLPVHPD
jgi:hypothetical protein